MSNTGAKRPATMRCEMSRCRKSVAQVVYQKKGGDGCLYSEEKPQRPYTTIHILSISGSSNLLRVYQASTDSAELLGYL